jgi:hypothetical protein
MSESIDKLIQHASSWVGYCEKKSNEHLDHFTKNAGSNNYTCFSRDYKIHTGINVQGQPWCDVFVDMCFISVFGKENAKKLIHGFSAYTPTSANYFKKNNQWHTNPKEGDVIFFKNSERICHTGIVYKVSSNTVYTIEGNTSGGITLVSNGGCVAKKSYSLNYSRIAGYGRPNYKIVEEEIDMEKLNELILEFQKLNNVVLEQKKTITSLNDTVWEQGQIINKLLIEIQELKNNQQIIYHYGTEIPEWGKTTLYKAQQKGVFTGASESDYDISQDTLKTLVFLDRLGFLD